MLTAGNRIGPYEILGSLGAGGMGEVYRGRDSRLDRDVAIKVLPRTFAEDPERRGRFDREARVLASLNHPNIAQVYGAEEAAGSIAIVMELVAGQDLAERIRRGPLNWAEARPIARQLAAGLDAAHERGIIHRDLKPANIRLATDDTVKILDFGLAKAIAPTDAVEPDPDLSPTFTSPATHLGTIIGTAAYMAPEQAKGRAVDKRADIWAFGVVLFEMLTGRSPFRADTAVESLGLVVTKEPDWHLIPPTVPRRIVELLERCLVKDPRTRLRDIGDAFPMLDADERGAEKSSRKPVASRSLLLTGVVLAIALAAIAAALAWVVKPETQVPLRRLELPDAIAGSKSMTISPNGRHLAYVSDGKVFVRSLDATEARELTSQHPTTDQLAWSPDSATVAFWAEGVIRTVSVSGGPVFTVTSVPGSGAINGMLWRADGSIVFSAWRESLYQVQASGGSPEVLLKVDPATEVDFHEISSAADGRLLVGVHQREENAVRYDLFAPGDSNRTILLEDSTVRDLRYAAPGRILFIRLGANQGLWSLPFAADRLDLSRSTRLVADAAAFSVSTEGTLIARSDAPSTSRLQWIARDGSVEDAPGEPIPDLYPWIALSPEADRVAYVTGRTAPVLLVRDLTTGADTRLMSESAGQNVVLGPAFMLTTPGWFPRGGRLFVAKGPIERSQIMTRSADGTGQPAELTSGSFGRVSADGRWFAWLEDDRGEGRLRYAALDDEKLGEKFTFTGAEKDNLRSFDLSPDGTLIVFSARDAGQQSNVHLMPFPGGTARWQVTTNGGTSPRFSVDGREVVYMAGARNDTGNLEGRLMRMPVQRQPAVRLGVATPLLTGTDAPSGFAPAPGGRLLVARRVPESVGRSRALLVQNWPAIEQQR